MQVRVLYGGDGLDLAVPDGQSEVVRPIFLDGVTDPVAAVRDGLRAPLDVPALTDQVKPGMRIALAICDHTRPQPRRPLLTAVIAELATVGPVDLTVLVATGTHRASTRTELVEMLGDDLFDRLEVVNHDARGRDLVDFGVVAGDVPVLLNPRWVEADIRMSLGVVEPHFFAGFSGGPKMVAPGLAGAETVFALHNAKRIASPDAIWGRTEGNPVHDAIRAAAALAPPNLAVEVLVNRDQEIADVFTGSLGGAHEAACAAARVTTMRAVAAAYPVVVTTNAGDPLDQNLYQAVKGLRAASQIVTEGGTIICAASCRDGLPDGSGFAREVLRRRSPGELYAEILARRDTEQDQWQAQILAQVLSRSAVWLKSEGLPPPVAEAAGLRPIGDLDDAVQEALALAGSGARVCVLPEGPQTIPFVDGRTPR